jgi:hypothetical protein
MNLEAYWWWMPPVTALAGVLLGWWWRGRRDRAARRSWPARWNLQARPLFNAHERALHRDLKAALPHHLVLAKVSLLRFCQPHYPEEARVWYDRLMGLHVSMVVCHPNGSVVSVIDFEPPSGQRDSSGQKFKEAVLEACRIRYLRCRPGQWPHQALLASWALGPAADLSTAASSAGGHPGMAGVSTGQERLYDAGDQLARKLRERRAERAARWAESGFAPDSFFAFDGRGDSGPAPLTDLGDLDEYGHPRPPHQQRA